MNRYQTPTRQRLPLTALVAAAYAVTFMLASNASAQGLTYVDANDFVNLTTSSGDPIGNAIDQFNLSTDIANDDLWRFRADAGANNSFGASGTIYEAFDTEDVQEIIQTVTGLSSGTSYDMYIVWWSDPGSWTLRGGLSSNPGGNPIYDRTGQNGTPGQPGVFANWTSPPADNPNIADGFPGIQGATLEGNRTMLVAQVGTATANGSGEVQVFVDDTMGIPGGHRTWFDGVAYAPAGTNAANLTATVDRTTGNLSINSSVDVSVTSINITSAAGALNPSNWTPITDRLDMGGNSTFDGDAWEITSTTANSLAENEIDRDPDPNVVLVDGGVIGPSGAATINFGNVWVESAFEDIIVNLTLTDSGFTVPVTVQYTGGTQILFGDFDEDNDIDVDDYRVVLRGLNRDLAGLTDLESYALGDVTGNQLTNFADLARFRELYDAANGTGAFASLTGVPEPTSLALLALAAFGGLACRRARYSRSAAAGLLAVTLCCCSGQAQAQITYIDADLSQSPSSNTFISGGAVLSDTNLGNWMTRGAGAVLTDGADDTNNFGHNGNTLQAGTADEVDELQIDFTIPTAGDYDIFAVYWDTTADQLWNVAAGLTSGNLTDYNQNSPDTFEVDATTQVSGGPRELLGLNILGQGTDDFSDFIDGNRTIWVSRVGTQTVSAGGSVSVFIDHFPAGKTGDQRTFFDGVGYTVAQPAITLEVNTTTGAVALLNPTNTPLDFSYYEITSAGNSLDPSGWNSLDAQNLDAVDGPDDGATAGDSLLEGWDVAGSSALTGDFDANGIVNALDLAEWETEFGTTLGGGDFLDWQVNLGESAAPGGGSPNILNETFFLGQSTLAATTGSLSFGNAYDTSVGAQDLVFRYGSVDDPGSLTTGRVKYVTSATAAAGAVPEPTTVLLTSLAIMLTCFPNRSRGIC